MSHVTSFAVYSYHPFTIIGLAMLLLGIAAGIYGGVEYENSFYVIAAFLAVVGIVLMIITKTVLYVHSSCEADKTVIKGSKEVLLALFKDIETELMVDSFAAEVTE